MPAAVGYSIDDRVMDPRGALKLYENAVNSPDRSMVDGVGHGQKKFDRQNLHRRLVHEAAYKAGRKPLAIENPSEVLAMPCISISPSLWIILSFRSTILSSPKNFTRASSAA